MTWKYRVVKSLIEIAQPDDADFPSTHDRYAYTIRHVKHDDLGMPLMISEEDLPYGESQKELQEDLLKMLGALNWPVIDDDKEYE